MAYQIKFGTDGWRGVIAEDYTFDKRCRRARRRGLPLAACAGQSGRVGGHRSR